MLRQNDADELSVLLGKLDLQQHLCAFEAEDLAGKDGIHLLRSMGAEFLRANLSELGLDPSETEAAAVAILTGEIHPSAAVGSTCDDGDGPMLEENGKAGVEDNDDTKHHLQPLAVVCVSGLVGRTELNGRMGRVLRYESDRCRYVVQLSDEAVLLKQTNLTQQVSMVKDSGRKSGTEEELMLEENGHEERMLERRRGGAEGQSALEDCAPSAAASEGRGDARPVREAPSDRATPAEAKLMKDSVLSRPSITPHVVCGGGDEEELAEIAMDRQKAMAADAPRPVEAELLGAGGKPRGVASATAAPGTAWARPYHQNQAGTKPVGMGSVDSTRPEKSSKLGGKTRSKLCGKPVGPTASTGSSTASSRPNSAPSLARGTPRRQPLSAPVATSEAEIKERLSLAMEGFLEDRDEDKVRRVLSEELAFRREGGDPLLRSWGADTPPAGETLVIAFGGLQQKLGGGVGTGMPPHEFVTSCRKAGASLSLFVRDAARSWYCRGVSTEAPTFDSLISALRRCDC